MNKSTKRGSYLVEAAMTLPIFILAVLMLISCIPVLSTSENAVYAMVDELRMDAVSAAFQKQPQMLSIRIGKRICEENRRISALPKMDVQYLYKKKGISSLITVNYKFNCKGNDPTGIFQQAVFYGRITARAFTGTLHEKPPLQINGESPMVYVFPEWGMRYHDADCTYVKGSCQMVYLTSETKKDYKPCTICDASSAQIGSPVFCFTRYGEVYHFSDCRQVERYYVQMERKQAEQQGYAPCSKCGG